MKRRRTFFKRLKAPIPILCYAVCAAVWLAAGAAGLCSDGIAKATGRLYQFELAAEDFEQVGLQRLESGALLTLDGDPQMIWENGEGAVLRTVRMEAAFDRSPREMCLYYTLSLIHI